MKRRSFILHSTLGALTTSTFPLKAQVRRKSGDQARITVVGAGIFGVWSAFYLQMSGAQVTLVDAYGPGNSRASSGGETRILRSDYGDKHHYTRMNIRAHKLWSHWQSEWNAQFMYSTGRIGFYDEAARQRMEGVRKYLQVEGIPSELLTPDEVSYRWPQIQADGIGFATYFPGLAGGSALMAREACRIVTEKFQELGGKLKIDKMGISQRQGKIVATLQDGTAVESDQILFACGPWMRTLFPDLFKDQLKVFRRDVFFVGPAAGDSRYSYPNLPIWSFNNKRDARFYGLPDIRGRGVKIAPWPDLNSIDMDRDDRFNNFSEIKQIRTFIQRRFPGLVDQPFLEGRVCQLTFSNNEEFIIDRHPENENIWLACAGSGHAFKHGPALGEYIAGRMLELGSEDIYQGHFRLKDH